MIPPSQLRNLLTAIHRSPYRTLGICPAHGGTPTLRGQACAVLRDTTATALAMAVQEAEELWPEETHWQLVGSDHGPQDNPQSGPNVLTDPSMLTGFQTNLDM